MTRKELKVILRSYFTDLCEDLAAPGDFEDVFCFRNETDPTHIYYVPLVIVSEKNSLDQAQFNFLATGSSNVLQLASRWDIDRALLKKLNVELLEKFEPEGIDFLDFSIPDVNVTEARLEIANDDAGYDTLQSSVSSGFFPFNTVFNVVVNEAEKPKILHALNGTDKKLRIIYSISMAVQSVTEAELSGDISDIPGLTNNRPDKAAIIEMLENAVLEGILTLTYTGDEKVKDKFTASLYNVTADSLKGFTKNTTIDRTTNSTQITVNEGLLTVKLHEKSGSEILIEPEANVADWFANEKTDLPVNQNPGKIKPETPQSGKTMQSDMLMVAPPGIEDTNINFIRITNQEHSVTLSPPDFTKQLLPKTTGGATHVTTSYTDGGEDFTTELSTDWSGKNEYQLAFSEIGLAEVVFDAGSLTNISATSARLHIQYKPAGTGTPDERTLFLKSGEWVVKWLVCSRDKSLNGELRYDIKVTGKDGKSNKYSGTSQVADIEFEIKN